MAKWESLKFIKQVKVVPEGPSQSQMYMDMIDEQREYLGMAVTATCVPYVSGHREHVLRYGGGWKTHFEVDFPEDFKKLVQYYGDYDLAYDAYQALQMMVRKTWMDEAQAKLNP